MILSTWKGKLLLIRQTDHAALSAALAENWGNSTFQKPDPYGPVVAAARLHDNGWQEWEAAPRINPATGFPYQFTEMPADEHLTFYWRGIERVLAQDRYAGLLVSMHCAGLYKQRYGTDPSLPPRRHAPEARQVIDRFLERLEAQQRDVRQQLAASAIEPGHLEEKQLWTNYKLLQVYDRLSLFLCLLPLQAHALGPAPVDYNGSEVILALTPLDERRASVSPYPFQPDALEVCVAARVIPKKQYASAEELQATLAQAEAVQLTYELQGE